MNRIGSLQYVRDGLFIRKLSGLDDISLSGIVSDIGAKAKGLDSPEAVLDFIGPGILWTLGFGKLAFVFEVAKALGFDFEKFFHQVREGLSGFVHDLFEHKKPNQSIIHQVVEESANSSFDNEPNSEKLQQLQKGSSYKDIQKHLIVLARGSSSSFEGSEIWERLNKSLSGVLGKPARSGITKILIRIFTFAISSIFISLGFFVIEDVFKKLLSKNDKKDESGETKNVSDTEEEPSEAAKEEVKNQSSFPKKNIAPIINPHLDSSFLKTTYNDLEHIWILHPSISNIRDQLIDWAETVYPQLTDANFDASSKFKQTYQMIKDRNNGSETVQLMAIPQKFTSIKQIVDSFASDVAAQME